MRDGGCQLSHALPVQRARCTSCSLLCTICTYYRHAPQHNPSFAFPLSKACLNIPFASYVNSSEGSLLRVFLFIQEIFQLWNQRLNQRYLHTKQPNYQVLLHSNCGNERIHLSPNCSVTSYVVACLLFSSVWTLLVASLSRARRYHMITLHRLIASLLMVPGYRLTNKEEKSMLSGTSPLLFIQSFSPF